MAEVIQVLEFFLNASRYDLPVRFCWLIDEVSLGDRMRGKHVCLTLYTEVMWLEIK